jgi:hypothetical protein
MSGKIASSTLFQRIFNMPHIYDMGPTAFLPVRRRACWGFFRHEKSVGFGRVRTLELGYQRSDHWNRFMDHRTICSTHCFNQFCWDWSVPVDLCPFSFGIGIRSSKALGWSSSRCRMHFSLCNIITPTYVQWLGEMVTPLSVNSVGVCSHPLRY